MATHLPVTALLLFSNPFNLHLELLSLLFFGIVRILNSQAPNIQIITDGPDDVNNEASVHTNRKTKAHEDERNLIDIVAQSTRPANADVSLQEWTERVCDAVNKRIDEDVAARETGLGEMRDDHAAYGIGVDETCVENEWHEMMAEDHWLEVQVDWNENPRGGEGQQTTESLASILTALASSLDDILGTICCQMYRIP